MHNGEQKPEVCDASKADSSNAGWLIIKAKGSYCLLSFVKYQCAM